MPEWMIICTLLISGFFASIGVIGSVFIISRHYLNWRQGQDHRNQPNKRYARQRKGTDDVPSFRL